MAATRQISEDGGSGMRRVRSARTVGVAGDALDQRGRWEWQATRQISEDGGSGR